MANNTEFDVFFVVGLNSCWTNSRYACEKRRVNAHVRPSSVDPLQLKLETTNVKSKDNWEIRRAVELTNFNTHCVAQWRYKTIWIWVNPLTCCLTASNHYPYQCWPIINDVFGNPVSVISQEMLKTYILDMSLKIIQDYMPHLRGINELSNVIGSMNVVQNHWHSDEHQRKVENAHYTDVKLLGQLQRVHDCRTQTVWNSEACAMLDVMLQKTCWNVFLERKLLCAYQTFTEMYLPNGTVCISSGNVLEAMMMPVTTKSTSAMCFQTCATVNAINNKPHLITKALQWRHNEPYGVSNHHVSTVCSTVFSAAHQRKHRSSASLAFVRGIHRSPVDPPRKGSVSRKMFPFYDVIMVAWHSHNPLSRQCQGHFTMKAPLQFNHWPWHDCIMSWSHFPHFCPFVRGIHQSPMKSPKRKVFRSFDAIRIVTSL